MEKLTIAHKISRTRFALYKATHRVAFLLPELSSYGFLNFLIFQFVTVFLLCMKTCSIEIDFKIITVFMKKNIAMIKDI